MKSSIFIVFFLLLVNCSSVKNNFSQINDSFSKLIISKKSIDSKSTRRPVGNKQYINEEQLEKDNSQIAVSEQSIEEKPKDGFQLSNIFKTKKSLDHELSNQHTKYPALNSVPELPKDYEKIISEKDMELKKMHHELDEVKKEVKILENNHNKVNHPIKETPLADVPKENHLNNNVNDNFTQNKLEVQLNENTNKAEENEIPNRHDIKNPQDNNNSYQQNSPKILSDLDDSGIYVKPRTKKTTRSSLLPNSRYN